jgi:putative toxin-antitoxin system antitoxin component (TIGR02293 family)
MQQSSKLLERSANQTLYQRIETKLGVDPLHSDHDLVTLVERPLPVRTLTSLTKHGIGEQEIYDLVLPRRTLTHRRAKHQLLTREESDKVVRLARITALAEQVFGDEAKAARWLRQPKRRFDSSTPFDLLATEVGAQLVEEMLYQIDDGMVA